MVVELNEDRLRYLLDLYKLPEKDFINRISEGLEKKLTHDDIFTSLINVNHLKRIDHVFKKGLSFYTDPSDPPPAQASSIFFRKTVFAEELNFTTKRALNDFETYKLFLSATAKALNKDFNRTLPTVTAKNDAKKTAEKFRNLIYPDFNSDQKEFLTSFINRLGNFNIIVLELIENWNQLEKYNIDGAFLNPNVIILKRQAASSFRREIFTLAHELAHYLLNVEEAEPIDYNVLAKENLSNIEKWCNDFAFHFLIHDFFSEFKNLTLANAANDYHHSFIEYLSNRTHLSQMALYTRLLLEKKITPKAYGNIKREAEDILKRQVEEEKRKREKERQETPDKGGGRPKPINSELLVNTLQAAFDKGVIGEYEMIRALRQRVR